MEFKAIQLGLLHSFGTPIIIFIHILNHSVNLPLFILILVYPPLNGFHNWIGINQIYCIFWHHSFYKTSINSIRWRTTNCNFFLPATYYFGFVTAALSGEISPCSLVDELIHGQKKKNFWIFCPPNKFFLPRSWSVNIFTLSSDCNVLCIEWSTFCANATILCLCNSRRFIRMCHSMENSDNPKVRN